MKERDREDSEYKHNVHVHICIMRNVPLILERLNIIPSQFHHLMSDSIVTKYCK